MPAIKTDTSGGFSGTIQGQRRPHHGYSPDRKACLLVTSSAVLRAVTVYTEMPFKPDVWAVSWWPPTQVVNRWTACWDQPCNLPDVVLTQHWKGSIITCQEAAIPSHLEIKASWSLTAWSTEMAERKSKNFIKQKLKLNPFLMSPC